MLETIGHLLVRSPLDLTGALLFVLVFPVYHALYPFLMRRPGLHASKTQIDPLRRSWIQGLIERRDIVLAAQQTRNLTMVNSLLASSSLILMGVCANVLIRGVAAPIETSASFAWMDSPDVVSAKLFVLMFAFAVSFGYCMTSLRHLGHFNLVIGADPEVIARHQGDPVDYLTGLINRASNRHTLAVRTLYSASPLLVWIFDTKAFILLTALWAFKFIGFQDFSRSRPAKREA